MLTNMSSTATFQDLIEQSPRCECGDVPDNGIAISLQDEAEALGRTFVPFFEDARLTLYLGDAIRVLRQLPSSSVDCVVTSPPYYGQRDYGVEGQLGLEAHPQAYIQRLVAIFREVRQVLKPSGSLWVNIGDTYWSGKGRPHGPDRKQKHRRFDRPQDKAGTRPWCTPKQLLLIPHRFAVAMQEDGWIVRNDNVWYKPRHTPDPVDDRCASAHEYVFHFVKQRRYYFCMEAVAVQSSGKRTTKPPPSVWTIATVPSQKVHSASFPNQLVQMPILATLPRQGILLDPFCGSGTALQAAVALGEGRRAIGIDVSHRAIEEAKTLLLSREDPSPSGSREPPHPNPVD
jgi:site-specific DNA-methyltransferase (cytosine-N4-specific)